jgi:hypothetical protein
MFLQLFQVQDSLARKYAYVILPYLTFFRRNDFDLLTFTYFKKSVILTYIWFDKI